MTESPLHIPVYEGSMISVRSTTPSMARARPMTGFTRRYISNFSVCQTKKNIYFIFTENKSPSRNGKLEVYLQNMFVHCVIVIWDFRFSSKIVDIMFAQVVYKMLCGMRRKR